MKESEGLESSRAAERPAALTEPGESPLPRPPGRRSSEEEAGVTGHTAMQFLGRFGVLLAFAGTAVLFAILQGDKFVSIDNLKTILIQASPLAIFAFGLTIPLALGDFDLSFGAVAGLVTAIVAVLMVNSGVAWEIAVLAGLGGGVVVGISNGIFVSRVGAPSFIVTLAASTVATGFEFLLTGQETIFEGIPNSFLQIARGSFLGFEYPVWIALVVLIFVYLLLQQSETGRRMYAVGGNRHAARLAGVNTQFLVFAGFVIMGFLAAVAGVVVLASAGAYTPQPAAGYLLPAYAACFLGASIGRTELFTAAGTLVGVLFLGIIENGLILSGITTAWINIVQGAILLGAIVLTRVGQR